MLDTLREVIHPKKFPYTIRYGRFNNVRHMRSVQLCGKSFDVPPMNHFQIYNIDIKEKKVYVKTNFIEKLSQLDLKDPKEMLSYISLAAFNNDCLRIEHTKIPLFSNLFFSRVHIIPENLPEAYYKRASYYYFNNEHALYNIPGSESYSPDKDSITALSALDHGLRKSDTLYSIIRDSFVEEYADIVAGFDDEFWNTLDNTKKIFHTKYVKTNKDDVKIPFLTYLFD